MDKQQTKIHPLVAAACISVVLFSLVGVAVMTGHLPTASSRTEPAVVTVQPDGVAAEKSPGSGQKVEAAGSAPKNVVIADKAEKPICANCGVVVSVTPYKVRGEATGVGAVAGGVVGALVGNQFGKGQGRTATTVIGAAGGAVIGNNVEKGINKDTNYKVTVRTETGAYRAFYFADAPRWRDGDAIRIDNGRLIARN